MFLVLFERFDGAFLSEPDLTTAADKRDWRNSGYPPGFTVDELRFYRRKRAPGDILQKDQLTVEPGNFRKLKSEYRCRFPDYYDAKTRSALLYDLKDLSPTRPNKPDDHLSIGVDEGDDSDANDEFQPEYHESFIEFPIEQRAAAASLNTYRRYKRQLDAMPRDDEGEKHLGSFGNHKSENRAQFVQHERVDRTLPIRRSTSLKLGGDFSPHTEKAEQFIKYLLQKRRSLIRNRSHLRLEGEMENKKTETREQYAPYEVQPRPMLYKKLTNLRLEGDLDITTENQEQFIPYSSDPSEIRPPLVKRSTNLHLEGDLRMSPEYRHEFVEYPGSERSSPSLPKHNLRVDGFFDSMTENQDKFIGHQIHPPIPFLRGSGEQGLHKKFLLGDDKHVGRAEYREKFIPHNIERSTLLRRDHNLNLEGDFESLTESRHSFVEHQQPHQHLAQRKANNLQLEGQFDMSPEYKNAYVDFYKTSNFSSPVRRRRVEGSLRSEGIMDAHPEYKRSFVDFPRQRPGRVRKPETNLSSEGEMDHMTEKRAQYIEYPGHRKPDAVKREPEFKLEGDFVCQPEYRKAYVNYLIRERVDHKHRPLDNLTGVAVVPPKRAFEILNADKKPSTTATITPTTDTTTSSESKPSTTSSKSLIPVATPTSTTNTTTTTTTATESTAYSSSTNSRIPRRMPSINTLETQLFGPKIEPPKTFRSSSSSRITSRSPSPLPPRSSRTRSLSRSSKTSRRTKGSSSEQELEKHRDRTGSRFVKTVRVEDLAYTPATSPIPTHKLYNLNYPERKRWEKSFSKSQSINEQIDRMTAFMILDDEINNNNDDFGDKNFVPNKSMDKSFYKEQKWMSLWNSPIA